MTMYKLRILLEYGKIYVMRISFHIGMFYVWHICVVRQKTAPDFLVDNMIDANKKFLNPATRTPGVRGGLEKKEFRK